MKKSLLLKLTFVLTLIFTGCSNDDDNNSTTSIVGKWKTVKVEYYTNGVLDETVTTVEDNSTCPDYIEFKDNGTYVVINNDVNCNSTVDLSGGTYVYNGTTISTTLEGQTDTFTVILLTNTDLKIDSGDTTVYFKKIN
jgi:hypothetical protein